jgi:hypothetical protein
MFVGAAVPSCAGLFVSVPAAAAVSMVWSGCLPVLQQRNGLGMLPTLAVVVVMVMVMPVYVLWCCCMLPLPCSMPPAWVTGSWRDEVCFLFHSMAAVPPAAPEQGIFLLAGEWCCSVLREIRGMPACCLASVAIAVVAA